MTEEKKKSKARPAEKSAEKKQPAGAEDKHAGETGLAADARADVPAIRPGDELKVFYRVIEAGKERIQTYEGTVIAIKNSGISKTITVRKNSFGIAVERIFPLNSKLVQKIEVKKHTKVRRAKLFYLRKLKGKASRLKELR
jgi:large subunit ribosomal protein L19